MLDLVANVLLSTLAVTHTATILIDVLLEITRTVYIFVVFVFLSTEALEDQVEEHSHGAVTQLAHALKHAQLLVNCVLQGVLQLGQQRSRVQNLLSVHFSGHSCQFEHLSRCFDHFGKMCLQDSHVEGLHEFNLLFDCEVI